MTDYARLTDDVYRAVVQAYEDGIWPETPLFSDFSATELSGAQDVFSNVRSLIVILESMGVPDEKLKHLVKVKLALRRALMHDLYRAAP